MVELKKELPEIFEEFAEQRKNSFLAIKEIKEKDIPVVGVFCTYLPREIPNAMGAAVVGLCSVSDETIADAEKDLPRNLCPLIKSSYGFAKTDKCPFFYFSDLVVGETTCDGKKKMYEELSKIKPMHVMQLPNRASGKYEFNLWKDEIILLKEVLEKELDITITEEDISRIRHWYNIIIEWNKNWKAGQRNLYWDMAYNRYLLDARDEYIENRFLNMGLVLECLLNIDGKKISAKLRKYAASLCASNQEEFENIFYAVKRGYDYRCKVVHGNAEIVAEIFNNELIYQIYFELRRIVNKLMLIMYGKTKEEVIEQAKILLENYDIPSSN